VHPLRLPVLIFLLCFAVSCGGRSTSIPAPSPLPSSPAKTSQPAILPTVTEVAVTPRIIGCDDWQSWPVIPSVSKTAVELHRRGQVSGNNPRAFSKIGDGEISTEWFLTAFDLGPDDYQLGPYQDLQPVIEYFAGSFGRMGIAAGRGFNTVRILDPGLGKSTLCESGESPLTCELRLHRPAFAILSLGTNQVWQPEEFVVGMRKILDLLISRNVLPILSTKGDNLEGDQRINKSIACLAQEYDVPLWNFWAAIQPLPHHGLQPDLEHLTYGIIDFEDAHAMQSAWTVRNLTALQVLNSVWRGVTVQP